jgi:hypothetical protein
MAKNPKKSQTLSEAKDLLFFERGAETHGSALVFYCIGPFPN